MTELTTKQKVSAGTRHMRERRAAVAAGTWQPFVSPKAARARLQALHDAGTSRPALSAACRMGETTVQRILNGVTREIRPQTERRILTMCLDPRLLPPRVLVSTVGTNRRLQALARLGWRYVDVGELIGMTPSAVSMIPRRQQCTAGIAASIAGAYAKLWMHRGPSQVVELQAIRRGLPGPLHWDEHTIDDPTVRVKGIRK